MGGAEGIFERSRSIKLDPPAPHLTKQLLLHVSTKKQIGVAGAEEVEIVSLLAPYVCFHVFSSTLALFVCSDFLLFLNESCSNN